MAQPLELEYGVWAKVKFVTIALPAFGIIGGVFKTRGLSDEAIVFLLAPLFVFCFVLSILATQFTTRRRARLADEAQTWRERESRLQLARERVVADQQDELRRIRQRQAAEQAQLLKSGGSKEQLGNLMDRHRAEYEELVRRQRLA
jgi:flagellar motility protein MotE (MotC chaperone)